LSLLGLDEGSDSIDHVLEKLLLGSSESSLVGDVEGSVVGLGVLSVDSSDLDVVLVGDLVEEGLVVHELGELDVNGSSESGSEVGGARGDVTKVVVVRELAFLLDESAGSAESVEDLADSSSLLHGDNSELILLVDPDDETLGLVVEDTSA
jgi:hypothetical protein